MKVIFHLLRTFCPPHLLEEIEGDLLQKFERDLKEAQSSDHSKRSDGYALRRAKRKLLWNVIRYFRPAIVMRNRFSIQFNSWPMFNSYMITMFRSMVKQKLNSANTILGLTIGITFALLIGVFVWGELQVNKDISDVQRIHLLEVKQKDGDGNMPPFFVPALLGPTAVDQYPTLFESCYRFRDRGITVSKADKHFRIQSMIGDSTFFEMFGFKIMYGSSANALNRPNSIVITEKVAKQFFGRTDVVDETLSVTTELRGMRDYVITAVLYDLQRKNSVSDFMNMNAQVFLSQENREDFNLGFADDWDANIITYIKLTKSVSPEKASAVLNSILKMHQPQADSKTIELNPLKDYYRLTNRGSVNKMITSLLVIMLFILVLAIVNFVNITTAASLSRIKEIGMRKAIGGIKQQVVLQFLLEAVTVAFLSGILSLLNYQLLHSYIGEVLKEPLPGLNELPISFWFIVALALFLIGITAGLYPAIWLSSTKTLDSLKGKLRSMRGTIVISRGLIAIQFSVAVFVFAAALIISQQISYFSEIDLGYDKSNVLIVSSLPRLWNSEGFNKVETAKTEFENSNVVKSVSLSWGAPNYNFDPFSAKIYRIGQSLDEGVLATLSATDRDYAEVYDFDIKAGKFFFDKNEGYVPNRLVVNESMQQALSLQVGDKVRMQFSNNEFTVVGIVKDFHFESLHSKVKPVVFTHTRDFGAYRYFSFKLQPGRISSSIQAIEDKWHKIFPNDPFDYTFTDERFQNTYKTELQLQKATMMGGVVILSIVLTGVLGLVSLQVTKRLKEIGIRKVLGAPTGSIINLISHEYIILMLVAFVVSLPLSYFFSQHWLSDFAYHIELRWWMFGLPAISLFVITILMVISQSAKAAFTNPVDMIRYE